MKSNIFLMLIAMILINEPGFSQILVSGTVTSADDGTPLPGASVIEKGLTNCIITDMEGKYSIKVHNDSSVLVFMCFGFVTQEITINKNRVINIALQMDQIEVNDVVVTAYGIKRSRLFKSSSIDKVTSTNSRKSKKGVSNDLNNKVTGLEITGNPGFKKVEKKRQPLKDVGAENESYAALHENEFKLVKSNPLSTFSIDVDRASYSNVRRFINEGLKPPADAVRIEEMINYFNYNYPEPQNERPIAVYTEVADCPWQPAHKLLHIGLQGKKISSEKLPPSNLVFLIDVSGSMADENKLPLLKEGFKLLINNLREKDRVAIVVYAGAAGLVLPSTPGDQKDRIIEVLDNLQSGGSTAGGAGINLAYSVAKENFIPNGNNRVILATDGDFNVGVSNDNEMEDLIEEKKNDGIFLTCLGFGMGNYKDSKMEILADKGNGNFAYIDNLEEAKKTLVSEFGSTMYVIAKDVKLQIEFNPDKVQAYRLIGYENRLLNDEDFNDDAKDAGDMGTGHSVTALYEIIPVGVESEFLKDEDELRYQKSTVNKIAENTNEIANLSIRFKEPESHRSTKFSTPVSDERKTIENCSPAYRFSASVALFGMLLRNSKMISGVDYQTVLELAQSQSENENDCYKKEFVELVKRLQ
ncbi:MAG: von Willebrand factor type A domain-containing protein [Bacteroidales bacterium]